jgi:predicted ABC-type ATPase
MPILYVIAGPNGIGKTTSSYDLVPQNTPLINSDEIAKEARVSGIVSVNTQEYSNQEALRLVNEQLKELNSFAIETNLSDSETWKFLLGVQQIGYQVHLFYISTDEVELLNTRISERTRLGDHYVRPDIVEQRYTAGLNLLNHYFAEPDVLELLDNSKNMTLMAEIRKGEVLYLSQSLPKWISKHFSSHLKEDPKEQTSVRNLDTLDEVRKMYDRLKKK